MGVLAMPSRSLDEKLGDPRDVEAATQVVSSKMFGEPVASHKQGDVELGQNAF